MYACMHAPLCARTHTHIWLRITVKAIVSYIEILGTFIMGGKNYHFCVLNCPRIVLHVYLLLSFFFCSRGRSLMFRSTPRYKLGYLISRLISIVYDTPLYFLELLKYSFWEETALCQITGHLIALLVQGT